MNAIVPLTFEQYLEFEQHSAIKHELLEGGLFLMAGTWEQHNLIAGNIFVALHASARNSGCRVFISDMRLRIETEPPIAYYPDVIVVCDEDSHPLFKTRPCLVVEVLSESIQTTDRREKRANYRKLPSIKTYLIVHQDLRRVEICRRGPSGEWLIEILDQDGEISLECPEMTLRLHDIYDGTESGTLNP